MSDIRQGAPHPLAEVKAFQKRERAKRAAVRRLNEQTTLEFVVQVDPHCVGMGTLQREQLSMAIYRAIEYAMDNDIDGAEALNRDEVGQVSVLVVQP